MPLSKPGFAADDIAVKTDQGTSTSGTTGTVIAEVAASAGKSLMAIRCIGTSTATANTALQFVLTFTDDTTETLVATNTNMAIIVTRAGVAPAEVDLIDPWLDQATAVKKVSVQTNGIGTGTRRAFVTALEV